MSYLSTYFNNNIDYDIIEWKNNLDTNIVGRKYTYIYKTRTIYALYTDYLVFSTWKRLSSVGCPLLRFNVST